MRPRERWLWGGVVLFTILTRIWRLATPNGLLFDEIWYVPDAALYNGRGVPRPWPIPQPTPRPYETTWLHPPFAKQIIAWFGVGPFPESMYGIRMPSVVAGCVVVFLVGAIAYRLWGSYSWAAAASLLVACDGLLLMQSRAATLDVFMCAFGLAAVYVALNPERRTRDLVWAWVLCGAAMACKWSAFGFVMVVAIITLRRGLTRQVRWRAVLGAGTASLVVYCATFWRFLSQPGVGLNDLAVLQWRMLNVQTMAIGPNPVSTRWWEWLLVHRVPIYEINHNYFSAPWLPLWSYAPTGNFALWWCFILLVPALLWLALRHRDHAAIIAMVLLACNTLPYINTQRNTYIYYLLPAVCVYPLGVLTVLRRVPMPWRRGAGIGIGLAVAVCAVLSVPFVYLYPLS